MAVVFKAALSIFNSWNVDSWWVVVRIAVGAFCGTGPRISGILFWSQVE